MSMSDVGSIIISIAKYYLWPVFCIQQLDVTIVGNKYSYISIIKN